MDPRFRRDDKKDGISDIKARIIAQARELGFDQIGFVRADIDTIPGERLDQFLALGRQGDMDWMTEKADRRRHPQGLWPEARSIIMLAVNYGPETDPRAALEQRDQGVISVYARNKDYHDLVKKRLKALARWIHGTYSAEVKVFVDTAPVMEKPLAERAGLGWQGKHTNLVSRELGSWTFLGSVFTTLEIAPDVREGDHCGQCRRCLDACPTAAFPAPYELDARRCISYLTIEAKEQIPPELRPLMGNRIYGCDDCLAVCPWNKFARAASEAAFHPRESLTAPLLRDLAGLDDAGFRAFFAGSPIKRVGRDRFTRNVLVAIGNSHDPDLAPAAEALLGDPAPLVRGMAVWALRQLLSADTFAALKAKQLPQEADPDVSAEWLSP
ncbi:tRNA epoxyqueuosine(34) reductase QueG [Govanella unica]|uniref:Epoxyqueuosine reductase n=1 Tax=Govanella unica TaxID=2975056 RepID=A0A9X3TVZ4_9PROT|nr:tRNA epoxyqueuosine(34) reductase QueG [Govania unica]MDA5192981.1 tRNA epoxyqueuosine(34) reductase QueG [Govania unica]